MGMNMKVKRKPIPYSGQGWTNSYPKSEYLSESCHLILQSIAKAVFDANKEYLSIVQVYLRNRARRTRSSSPERFYQNDLDKMKAVVGEWPPKDSDELLYNLRDVTYIDIWDRAADNMAFLKSHWKHQTKKHQDNGRKRASDLRNCKIAIETGFHQVQKEMQSSALDLELTCDGIQEKIDSLKRFEMAYPITPSAPAPSSHLVNPFKSQTSILIFVVMVYITLSLIPISMAWSKATREPGSAQDSDFWILIQNGICQVFGLLVSVYTVHRGLAEDSTAWKCALGFTIGGIICAIAAIPMYLFLSPMWSAIVSFCASTAQFGVILEIATMEDHPKLKQA